MARMMRMLLVLLLFILTGPAQAAAAQTTAPAHTTGMGDALRQGERLARELTLTTGVAVSPLLGVVLNKVDMQKQAYGKYGKYGQYKYGDYGQEEDD